MQGAKRNVDNVRLLLNQINIRTVLSAALPFHLTVEKTSSHWLKAEVWEHQRVFIPVLSAKFHCPETRIENPRSCDDDDAPKTKKGLRGLLPSHLISCFDQHYINSACHHPPLSAIYTSKDNGHTHHFWSFGDHFRRLHDDINYPGFRTNCRNRGLLQNRSGIFYNVKHAAEKVHLPYEALRRVESRAECAHYFNHSPVDTTRSRILSSLIHKPNVRFHTYSTKAASSEKHYDGDANSQHAVMTALLCNGLVLALKVGVFFSTQSSVMLAEAVHSLADLANQGLLAYGLFSSKRAPDANHPYGYTKERFVWALISATGIFCLGSGLTIMHGAQCLYNPEPIQNISIAAGVILASSLIEGASLYVALKAVMAGAQAEKMSFRDYLWRGHDPTAVAVLMEDGAAVTGLGIAALSMAAVAYTGNHVYDALGTLGVGGLMGVVAIVLIRRNRESLLGRSMDAEDVRSILHFLRHDPVVDGIWDCKSEVIGPSAYRFKVEIDFNGIVIVQHYLNRFGRDRLFTEVRDAVATNEVAALDRVMANYGEELMTALGWEVDRLESEIKKLVPEIRHVDIEAHNPLAPMLRER